MHPRRLLLFCVASNSKNKYWGYKLACIRAHVELSNTFVYDYEVSVGTNGNDTHICETSLPWSLSLIADFYVNTVKKMPNYFSVFTC